MFWYTSRRAARRGQEAARSKPSASIREWLTIMRHFLSLLDVSETELKTLLADAARMKADLKRGHRPPLLAGHVLGMIFEKPSLRTRASFEAAMGQLGGSSIFFGASDGAMGQ